MNVGSLFTGIGGIDLGLERAGMRVAWQCERDPYCQRVLQKHWPDADLYGDIRLMPADDIEPVDVICGGFPCQPVSYAGARAGREDERWLWPEFARIVRLLRPRFVLVENVPGLLTHGMGDVLGDLAACGYDAEWDCVPAVAVGAPHRRDRVWIVAYPGSVQHEGARDAIRRQAAARLPTTYADGEGEHDGAVDAEVAGASQPLENADGRAVGARRIWGRAPQASSAEWWAAEPDVGRVAHGVPRRLDRLAALGNAVVPQVAEWIGRRMMEAANA